MKRFGLLVTLAVSQLIYHVSARGYCIASGDPHYRTFDGYRYDFQGGCRYIHTTDACPSSGSKGKMKLATFKVIADNVGSGVTWVKNVDVQIHGTTINLRRYQKHTPHTTADYSLTHEHGKVVIRSIPSAITVKWNRHTTLEILLEEKYRGKVCGLCGNFDGNAANERITSTGSMTNSINAWGRSWRAGGQCGRPHPPTHPCEKHPYRRKEALKDCAVIRSKSFDSCKAVMNLEPVYHNCVYDACANGVGAAIASRCEAISDLSTECTELKPNIKLDWGHLNQKCHCKKMAQMEPLRECCKFPFKYGGRYHYKCLNPNSDLPLRKPWCSIVDDLDKQQGPLNFMGECWP